ncbi:MAG TPA: hypothetical protein VJZ00_01750 [Thermoanaerobaculia bacterium]|nr:hypothetical protein [Thermoanaerobaculia bacterium]
MRITTEKNLRFADQPNPLLPNEVREKLPSRKRKKDPGLTEVTFSRALPTEAAKVDVKAQRDDQMSRSMAGRVERSAERLDIRIANFPLGVHAFPPGMKVKEIERAGEKERVRESLRTDGFLPDHLDFNALPAELPAELRTPPFFEAYPQGRGGKAGFQATTIFPPDNRVVFNDTAYPWSTCGRVDTPLGSGSGVMVGPRHLLTVSHVIQWNGDGSAGWVRFRPSFFNGSAPFGEAWGVTTYFSMKVSGPTIDWIEAMYDYVCVVLDRPIGNSTGWMGAKGYSDSWDGGAYWSHIGYPADLTAANRPTFQGGIALDGAWWELDANEAISHRADVWPGQSGGPLFGWWSGESYPSAVAVQSSQNSSENNASGGQTMVNLILRARGEHP